MPPPDALGSPSAPPGEAPLAVPEEIIAMRRSIDNIDAAMVYMLAERFRLTGKIGEIKAAVGLPPADAGREQRQMARLTAIADEAGLDVEFANSFRAFVTAEVIRHHEYTAALAKRRNSGLTETVAYSGAGLPFGGFPVRGMGLTMDVPDGNTDGGRDV